ncbi:kelch motif family protein [Stylonychia lemnae]|uniref:Kelch motif family protein n=1 Tax=Stylonychia lemnae TaxID=5949 RepID=A0A077ZVA6_STYLE|nr:kelch motif family protein [Stylonychia lemnae]|eukprot:CDW73240.1 kelch motif family protein [Stylonychia lemnae]
MDTMEQLDLKIQSSSLNGVKLDSLGKFQDMTFQTLDGSRILKDMQNQQAQIKKEWDDREKTLKSIVKETFKLIEVEINYDSMQSFLKDRIKCNIDFEQSKKLDVLFFFQEPQINRLYYFKPNSKKLYLYHTDFHLKQKMLINIDFKIPVNFASVQTKSGRIFIAGGSKNDTESLNSCYELMGLSNQGIDEEMMEDGIKSNNQQANLSLKRKANMITGRESHSLVCLNAKFIFALGSRINKQSSTCETYDIQNDTWTKIASLNYGRYYCSACQFNKRFVYVIGGINKNGLITQIEKYDSFQNDSKWQVLELSTNSVWEGRYFCGSNQIGETKIIIFGGFSGSVMTSTSFELDVIAMEVKESIDTQLSKNDSFYQRQPLLGSDKLLYAIGYESNVIHVYADRWGLLLKDTINWKDTKKQ